MRFKNIRAPNVRVWLAAALVVLSSAACTRPRAAEDKEAAPEDAGASVAEVTITPVERADIRSALAVTGTISALPNQDVKVSSLVPGRIARLMVAEGDQVRQDQVVAQIEDRSYRDQLQQAEAAVEQAQANLENAGLNRDRNETLFKRGIAARKDVEDARTQMSVSQAALSQVQAQLALARLQLARTQARSPLPGTVVRRFVSGGEQVDGTGAQPLFEVANLRQAELYGNVPASYLGRIRVGETLNITTDAFPGRTFAGRVVAISPAVDSATNVGLVRIRMANPQGLLRLGMFLSAELPIETHSNALVVPPQAVYRDGQGRPRVYRVRGDQAEAAAVQLGIETHDRVELLSGVTEGETVILTGGYGLGDHARVKVLP